MPTAGPRSACTSGSALTSDCELGGRQSVICWVVEPGDEVAAGGLPNAEVVLFHAVEVSEDDASVTERADRRRDVADGPANDRVRRASDLGHCRDAEHCSVRVEHAGNGVLLDKGQAEGAGVEVASGRHVACRNEW